MNGSQVRIEDSIITAAFEGWCARRACEGRGVTLLDLYRLVAEDRAVEPEMLDRQERALLARLAYGVIYPGFELVSVGARDPEPVIVVAYDPAWPDRFEGWRELIVAALGRHAVAVEHLGSTAIPGLAAKPIIDVQVSVVDVDAEDTYVRALGEAGVQLRGRDAVHRFLMPCAGRPRDVHVHVCGAGSEWEREHLLLRDYLRAHPPAAASYGDAKQHLAAKWRDDRAAYTEAKTEVILDALQAAERWAAANNWTVHHARRNG